MDLYFKLSHHFAMREMQLTIINQLKSVKSHLNNLYFTFLPNILEQYTMWYMKGYKRYQLTYLQNSTCTF